MTCQLYRHFDAEGRLLYVGISLSAVERLKQHVSRSGWSAEIASITVETHADREAAMKAEREAVERERPLYNKQLVPKGQLRMPFPDGFNESEYDGDMPKLGAKFHDAIGWKTHVRFEGSDDGLLYIYRGDAKPIALDFEKLRALAEMADRAKKWRDDFNEIHADLVRDAGFEL